jgi:hypothetical protein
VTTDDLAFVTRNSVEGVHLTCSRQRRTTVLDGFGRLGGRYKWGEKRHIIYIEVARLHKK